MKAGNIIFTFNGQLFSKLIKFFTTRKDNPVVMTHCGVMVDDKTYIETDIQAKISSLKELDKCEYWEMWECPGISDLERFQLAARATLYFNRTYSVIKILCHMIDAILGKLAFRDVFFVRKLAKSEKYIICSWIPTTVYHKHLGINFTDPYYAATPDDIHDFVDEHKWTLVDKKQTN